MATPGVEGAEGHGHSDPNLHIQDTEVRRLRATDTDIHKQTSDICSSNLNMFLCSAHEYNTTEMV